MKASSIAADSLARLGLVGQRDYRRFIIVGSRRTGTNYLLHLLRSTGQVICFAELFSNHGCYWANRSVSPIMRSRAERLRDREPDRFLEQHVFRNRAAQIRAVGFKAHYGHLERHPTALERLRGDHDLVVLHLRRNDAMARIVSQAIAHRSGEYTSTGSQTRVGTIRLSPADVLADINRYLDHANWPSEHLPSATTIELDYEHIAGDPEGALAPAFAQLRVDRTSLSSPIERQRTRHWRDAVTNADEILEVLTDAGLDHLPGVR